MLDCVQIIYENIQKIQISLFHAGTTEEQYNEGQGEPVKYVCFSKRAGELLALTVTHSSASPHPDPIESQARQLTELNQQNSYTVGPLELSWCGHAILGPCHAFDLRTLHISMSGSHILCITCRLTGLPWTLMATPSDVSSETFLLYERLPDTEEFGGLFRHHQISSIWCRCGQALTSKENLKRMTIGELPSQSWHELTDAWSCHANEFSNTFRHLHQRDSFLFPDKLNRILCSLTAAHILSAALHSPSILIRDPPSREKGIMQGKQVYCAACDLLLGALYENNEEQEKEENQGLEANQGGVILDLFAIRWSVSHLTFIEAVLVRQLQYYIQYDSTFYFILKSLSYSHRLWVTHAKVWLSIKSACFKPVMLLTQLPAHREHQDCNQIDFFSENSQEIQLSDNILSLFLSLFAERQRQVGQLALYL
jgi:hypothetical protein